MRKLLKPLLLLSLLASGASQVLAAPGEHYPQTRTRILHADEIANMSAEQRRYAINEIYARHGLLFGDMALRRQFLKFSWYKPQPGRSMQQVKATFSRTERQNMERLGLARDLETAGTKADDSDDDYRPSAPYVSPYLHSARAWKGEHFPETRLDRLRNSDVEAMSDERCAASLCSQ